MHNTNVCFVCLLFLNLLTLELQQSSPSGCHVLVRLTAGSHIEPREQTIDQPACTRISFLDQMHTSAQCLCVFALHSWPKTIMLVEMRKSSATSSSDGRSFSGLSWIKVKCYILYNLSLSGRNFWSAQDNLTKPDKHLYQHETACHIFFSSR